jgi:F0F1-type ATP synthase membrane subunit b/b'
LSDSKQSFDESQRKLDAIMDQLEVKIRHILTEICLRFTQEVEARFYADMNNIFTQLRDFEEKMREIALKAAIGEYGSVGNRANLDLHIQF